MADQQQVSLRAVLTLLRFITVRDLFIFIPFIHGNVACISSSLSSLHGLLYVIGTHTLNIRQVEFTKKYIAKPTTNA